MIYFSFLSFFIHQAKPLLFSLKGRTILGLSCSPKLTKSVVKYIILFSSLWILLWLLCLHHHDSPAFPGMPSPCGRRSLFWLVFVFSCHAILFCGRFAIANQVPIQIGATAPNTPKKQNKHKTRKIEESFHKKYIIIFGSFQK